MTQAQRPWKVHSKRNLHRQTRGPRENRRAAGLYILEHRHVDAGARVRLAGSEHTCETAMQDTKEKVAFGSILASGGLTAAKTVVGLASGSLAILSEAAHSLIDFGATVMTYVAVRISGKPA